ncbi:hypothetical protein PG985_004504 [Apiospora marii]|uniref:uncharacterized protein n=1 Tax=Apiospora marii TaxID=335849 RepID=UPI00312D1CFA
MSSSTSPTYTNAPLPLLSTPRFETGKVGRIQQPPSMPNPRLTKDDWSLQDDPFTIEASHMALSHNAFIRGFNSIYQQAPRLKLPADKSDFVGYCLAWMECVEIHHHYEETALFPSIDKAAGQKGLMDAAVHEHETFYSGLDRMKKYLRDKGSSFAAGELLAIMDSFKEALHSHLKSEPPAIAALAKYDTAEHPIDIAKIANAAGRSQITWRALFNTLPVFFLNMETATFEDGIWHDVFPPLKGVVRVIMLRLVPMWHPGRWRFTSCSHDGRVKPLAV